MRRARPDAFLELVHRLDKETSGLLLVAKTRPALVRLQNDLRSREPGRAVGKTYAALVVGAWPASLKVIDVALRKDTAADGSRHVRAVDADDVVYVCDVINRLVVAVRRGQPNVVYSRSAGGRE